MGRNIGRIASRDQDCFKWAAFHLPRLQGQEVAGIGQKAIVKRISNIHQTLRYNTNRPAHFPNMRKVKTYKQQQLTLWQLNNLKTTIEVALNVDATTEKTGAEAISIRICPLPSNSSNYSSQSAFRNRMSIIDPRWRNSQARNPL